MSHEALASVPEPYYIDGIVNKLYTSLNNLDPVKSCLLSTTFWTAIDLEKSQYQEELFLGLSADLQFNYLLFSAQISFLHLKIQIHQYCFYLMFSLS